MKSHLDLCSGIGGFALAAQWAGMQTIGFCEIDPWCQKVISKHWPNLPVHEDVRTLNGGMVDEWRQQRGFDTIDLLTAGYPCQPFSLAGKRTGENDDRHLWPSIMQLVRGIRPRWCIFENVAGHITMGLDSVLTDLESEDYTWWSLVIPAASVDAPHRRDRVWIIAADASGERIQGLRRLEDSVMQTLREEEISIRGGAYAQQEGWRETVDAIRVEDDGLSRRVDRYTSMIPWWTECICDQAWCTRCDMHLSECNCDSIEEQLHFINGWWGGDPLGAFSLDWDQGVSPTTNFEYDYKNKMKALGNAIVPQVAHTIIESIIYTENMLR